MALGNPDEQSFSAVSAASSILKTNRQLTTAIAPLLSRLEHPRGAAASTALPMPTPQEIIDYYDFSKLDYCLYNGSFCNLSMHYGLWDECTGSHRQALLNENRVLAGLAGIAARDRVIDLGCGYGASAVWLASKIGCPVLGVTLSQSQVDVSRKLAKRYGVDRLATFAAMDFHRLDLSDESFDVAFAIESLSHSADQLRVLKECFRILKPGGRIVVADGYFAKRKTALNVREEMLAKECFAGVHVPPLPEQQEFEAWLRVAGFSMVRCFDKTTSILPTAGRVHRLGKILLPVSRILGALGIRALQTAHMKAFINQYFAFRDGLGMYGVFCARKTS